MIIDAHVHFPDDHPDLLNMLQDLDVLAFNISFANQTKPEWRAEADRYRDLAQRYPQHYRWCTTFALPTEGDSGYVDRVIAGLDKDFAAGAIGCKVWKSYGMELRRRDGSPVLVNDPVLAPIFEHMRARGYPVLMHIGDPLAAWMPLDHPSPHQNYYQNNPEWHMAGKQGFPTHAEIIAARDNMLANQPGLTVIGAHLGSLEHDVHEVAARLDQFPDFHVDISARLGDMMMQDSGVVREFFQKYQDRILYGTDIVLRERLADMRDEDRTELIQGWREIYRAYCAYLERGDDVSFRGYTAPGLDLDDAILDKLYRENARRIYLNV